MKPFERLPFGTPKNWLTNDGARPSKTLRERATLLYTLLRQWHIWLIMECTMAKDVKYLQRLKEPKDGPSLMEWSTISNVHVTEAADLTADLLKQLQELPDPDGASLMEWSTVSNVHVTRAAIE